MSRYYVFYGEQLHSEYTRAIDYWNAKDRGEIPDGSYRYCSVNQEWTRMAEHRSLDPTDKEDVPPLLRAMALMLGD